MTGYDPRYGFELNYYGAVPPAMARVPLRRRRWVRGTVKWTAVGLLMFGAAWAGVRWYLGFEARQAVEVRTAELDRIDRDWRWETILGRRLPIGPLDNAANIVNAAANRIPTDWPNRPATPGGRLPGFQPSGQWGVSPWFERFEDVLAPFRVDESIAAEMRGELAMLEGALVEARPLGAAPRLGRFKVDWQPFPAATALPHLERIQAVTRLLRFDAVLRAEDRRLDDALTSCRGVLAVGMALGDEPATYSQLLRTSCHATAVRLAERLLAQGEFSPEALRETQELFTSEADSFRTHLLNAVRAERGQVFNYLGLIADGEIDLEELQATPSDPLRWEDRAVAWCFGRHRVRRCQAATLDMLTAGVQALDLRPEQQQGAFTALEDRRREFLIEYEGLGLAVSRLLPNVARYGGALWRDRALMQSAQLAFAAERFRAARGRWPETLAELAPEFIPAVPDDPYFDGPFRLRRTESGIIIYSIGPDREDHEGRIIRVPRFRGEGDIGFQLWDPQRRGRQPLPQLELRTGS